MTRRGTVLAVAVATVVVAACSSSGDTAPTSPPSPPTVAATTTEPHPTTTVATTTTELPTTTLDPAETLAAEVEADYREAIQLGREASQDPFNSEREQAALDRRLGIVRENFASKLETYREKNYAIRESEIVPSTIVVEIPAQLIPPSNDVVELQVCEVDSWIVVEVGAGPNGTDAIVNPDFTAYRAQVFLRNVEGVWRYEGGNDLQSWEGSQTCPAD